MHTQLRSTDTKVRCSASLLTMWRTHKNLSLLYNVQSAWSLRLWPNSLQNPVGILYNPYLVEIEVLGRKHSSWKMSNVSEKCRRLLWVASWFLHPTLEGGIVLGRAPLPGINLCARPSQHYGRREEIIWELPTLKKAGREPALGCLLPKSHLEHSCVVGAADHATSWHEPHTPDSL